MDIPTSESLKVLVQQRQAKGDLPLHVDATLAAAFESAAHQARTQQSLVQAAAALRAASDFGRHRAAASSGPTWRRLVRRTVHRLTASQVDEVYGQMTAYAAAVDTALEAIMDLISEHTPGAGDEH